MTMTSRERFAAMLNHKAPDRMPVYPLVNSISRQSLGITYEEWTKDINKCAEAIIRTTDELELDCLCTLVDLSVEAADFGQELLYFTDKAACPDPAHRVVPTEGDYDKIPRIDPAKGKRMSEHVELCRKLVKARGKDKPVVAFVFGPLGIVSMLRGQQEMFMDLYTAPDEVKKGVEIVSDVLCDWIDQLCATGIDAVMFDTLYASRSIMSAEMWDEFEGVYMTRIAERVRSHGCAVMIHNCGQGAYFDEQYERMKPVLFSFAHPPQGCADMKEAVEKYADKMILMGTIDPGWFMTATPETLKARVEEELAVFGPSKRYVLSTGCESPVCLPPPDGGYGEGVPLQIKAGYPHPALRPRFPRTRGQSFPERGRAAEGPVSLSRARQRPAPSSKNGAGRPFPAFPPPMPRLYRYFSCPALPPPRSRLRIAHDAPQAAPRLAPSG